MSPKTRKGSREYENSLIKIQMIQEMLGRVHRHINGSPELATEVYVCPGLVCKVRRKRDQDRSEYVRSISVVVGRLCEDAKHADHVLFLLLLIDPRHCPSFRVLLPCSRTRQSTWDWSTDYAHGCP